MFLVLLLIIAPMDAIQNIPNLVLIVLDDLGRSDHSIYTDSTTRSLAKLESRARSGIILENLYTSPVCSPTRSSLMTGLYPFRMGMQHTETVMPGSSAHVPMEDKMIPEVLMGLGYESHHVGKWHMGYAHPNFTSVGRGFNSHYGYYQGQVEYVNKTVAFGKDMWRNGKADYNSSEEHSTVQYISEVTNILENIVGPFFLYLALQTVHVPLRGRDANLELCEYEPDFWSTKYCELLKDLENIVDHVFVELQRLRLYENSIIVVVSDNGGMTNFVERVNGDVSPTWPSSRGYNAPLRGGKTTLFEGGVKSTAFISGGLVSSYGGKVLRSPSHAVDLHATLMNAAGLPEKIGDGYSLLGQITRGEVPKRDHVPINIINSGYTYSAIRCGDLKLVVGSPAVWMEADGWWSENGREDPPNHSGPIYAFNLTDDPYERKELDAEKVAGLVSSCFSKIRNYVHRERYSEPQLNLVSRESLPRSHNGFWAPFLE